MWVSAERASSTALSSGASFHILVPDGAQRYRILCMSCLESIAKRIEVKVSWRKELFNVKGATSEIVFV